MHRWRLQDRSLRQQARRLQSPQPAKLCPQKADWCSRKAAAVRTPYRTVLAQNLKSRRLGPAFRSTPRSEEHTSELQSRRDLVCRLLLEKKKKKKKNKKKTKK